MRRTFNVISVIALVLTIIGAINWLLVGAFAFNLVNWISFGMTWFETLLYVLVGISGIYMIVWLFMAHGRMVEDCNCGRETRYNH